MTVPSSALSQVPETETAALSAEAAAGEAIPQTGTIAAVAALTAAPAFRTAAAALPPAQGPTPGPAGDDDSAPRIADNPSRRDRPHRLGIGWHTASPQALAAPAPGSGLILGRDDTGQAVTVPFFRADPLRATLIGSHRLAQIVLLRVLALGAAAVVVSADPPAWHGFGRSATGAADRVVVLPEGRPVTAFGTADQPALVLYDLDPHAPAAPGRPGPWQTRLTVLRTRTLAEESEILLVEGPDGDDTVVLVQAGVSRRVHICPTSIERQAFGTAMVTAPAGTMPTAPAAHRPYA